MLYMSARENYVPAHGYNSKKKATSGTQRFTKGGKTLRVQNLSKKQLNYYSEMVDYGFFDIGIDGEVNEDKDDVAIEQLRKTYKVTNERSPKKMFIL